MNKIKFVGILMSFCVAANFSFVLAAPKEVQKNEEVKDQKKEEEKKEEKEEKESLNKIVKKEEDEKDKGPLSIPLSNGKTIKVTEYSSRKVDLFSDLRRPDDIIGGKKEQQLKEEEEREMMEYKQIKCDIIKDVYDMETLIKTIDHEIQKIYEIQKIKKTKHIDIFNDIINFSPNNKKQDILKRGDKVGVISFLCAPGKDSLFTPESIKDFFYKYLFYEMMLDLEDFKIIDKKTKISFLPKIFVISPITGEVYGLDYQNKLQSESFVKNFVKGMDNIDFKSPRNMLKDIKTKDSFESEIIDFLGAMKKFMVNIIENVYNENSFNNYKKKSFDRFSLLIMKKIKEIFADSKEKKDKGLRYFKTLLLALEKEIGVHECANGINNLKLDVESNIYKFYVGFDDELKNKFENKLRDEFKKINSEFNEKKQNILKSNDQLGVISFLFSLQTPNVDIPDLLKDFFYKCLFHETLLYYARPPFFKKEPYESLPNIYVISPITKETCVLMYRYDYSQLCSFLDTMKNFNFDYFRGRFKNSKIKDFFESKLNFAVNYLEDLLGENIDQGSLHGNKKEIFDKFSDFIIKKTEKMLESFEDKKDIVLQHFYTFLRALKRETCGSCGNAIKTLKLDVAAVNFDDDYMKGIYGKVQDTLNGELKQINSEIKEKKQNILKSNDNVGVISFLFSPKKFDVGISDLMEDFFYKYLFYKLMVKGAESKILGKKTNKLLPNIYVLSPITGEKYVLNYWDSDLKKTYPFLENFSKDIEDFCFSKSKDTSKNTETKDFFNNKIFSLVYSLKLEFIKYIEKEFKNANINKNLESGDDDRFEEFNEFRRDIFYKLIKIINDKIKNKLEISGINKYKTSQCVKPFLLAIVTKKTEINDCIDGIKNVELDVASNVYDYMQKKFDDVLGIIDDEFKTELKNKFETEIKKINSKSNEKKQDILKSNDKVGVISFLSSPQNPDVDTPYLIEDFFYKYLFHELMLNISESKIFREEPYKSLPNIYVISPITGEEYVLNYRDSRLGEMSFVNEPEPDSSCFKDRFKNSKIKDFFDYKIYSLGECIKFLASNKYGIGTLEDIKEFNNKIFDQFSEFIITKTEEIFENSKDKKDKILKYFKTLLLALKNKISIDDCITGIKNIKLDITSNDVGYKIEKCNNEYECFNDMYERIVGKDVYDLYSCYFYCDFKNGILLNSHLTDGELLKKEITFASGQRCTYYFKPITLVKQDELQKIYDIPKEYFIPITNETNDIAKDCRTYFFNIIFRIKLIKYLKEKLKNGSKNAMAFIDLSKTNETDKFWCLNKSFLFNKNIDTDLSMLEKHCCFVIFYDIDDGEIFSLPRIEGDDISTFARRIYAIIFNKAKQKGRELDRLTKNATKEFDVIMNKVWAYTRCRAAFKEEEEYVEKEWDPTWYYTIPRVMCVPDESFDEFKKTYIDQVGELKGRLEAELEEVEQYPSLNPMNRKMHDYFYESLDDSCNMCTEFVKFFNGKFGVSNSWLFEWVKKNYNENYYKKKDELKQCISFMLETKNPLNYYIYSSKDKDIITSFTDKLAIYFLYLYLKQYMDEYLEKNKESGLKYEINIEVEGKEQLSYIKLNTCYLPYCVHIDIMSSDDTSKLEEDAKNRLKKEISKFKEYIKNFINSTKMEDIVKDLKAMLKEGVIDVSPIVKKEKEIGKVVGEYVKTLGNIPFLKDYIEYLSRNPLDYSVGGVLVDDNNSVTYVATNKWLGNNIKEFYKLCKIDKENENVYDNSENKDSKSPKCIELEREKELVLKSLDFIINFFKSLNKNYTIHDIYWVDEKNIGKKNDIAAKEKAEE